MNPTAKGGGTATVSAVIKRADGTVEDWGRIVHASDGERLKYELAHPVLMLKRLRWRRKWRASSQIQD
jgi:hypothetical protein